MGKWTESQKRYARSEKGKVARKKYQSSEKAKEARRRYMLKRKARLTETKQEKEINPVKAKSETGKIVKEALNKK
jgi:hypothetical protein